MREDTNAALAAAELLPCPFCGEGVEVKDGHNSYISIRCSRFTCGGKPSMLACVSHFEDRLAAVAYVTRRWNTRAKPCSDCGRVAPLVHGECPECRHWVSA